MTVTTDVQTSTMEQQQGTMIPPKEQNNSLEKSSQHAIGLLNLNRNSK